jgi:hypothetical protein
VYASPGADGLAFGPDGTLYAAAGGGVVKIAGTDSPTPGAESFLASVPSNDGMAVSANPGSHILFGNRNDGIITQVNFTTATPTLTNIVTGGSRGDFATVGSDGCLYATQSDSIIKVTNADGSCLPPPLGPLFPPNPTSTIKVSKFFTDSSFNPLPTDLKGNPKVDVVLANGIVKSTNPGQIIGWVNVTNTASVPLQSLKLNDTLPADWEVAPQWLPAKGGIQVLYANSTSLSTDPDITVPSTIQVFTGNPETVSLAIPSFNTTGIGHPLLPGQSILLGVKLGYGLDMTSQSSSSYPRNYTDKAVATGWSKTSYTGTVNGPVTAKGMFVAYAKVVGDVDNDGHVDITDLALVATSFGAAQGSSNWNSAADLNNDGRIDIADLSIVAAYFGS